MSASTPGRVHGEADGAVGTILLDNPRRFNAMTRTMWQQLRLVVTETARQPGLRLIVLRGAGGHFCAGGDISEYPDFRFESDSLRAFHEDDVWGALSALLACDVPLVAQISGHCMGAGMELACCCDLRVAAASAQFGAPIAKLGFPMAPRELALVAQEAGRATARQMLLEAAVLSAADLAQRGFLSRVVADEDLQAVVHATVDRMRGLSPRAARLNKQALRKLFSHPALVEPGSDAPDLDAEVRHLLAHAYDDAGAAEHREGIQAFLHKRAPRF